MTVSARQPAARPGLGTDRIEPVEGEGTVRFENMGPGKMQVQVVGSVVASEREVVTVVSGVDAVVDVTTRGARRQTLEFMIPERGWRKLTTNLYDEADDLYYEISRREGGGSDPLYGVMPWFPVGRFRVEAGTQNGLTVSGEVVIESLDEADSPVLFEMR